LVSHSFPTRRSSDLPKTPKPHTTKQSIDGNQINRDIQVEFVKSKVMV